MEPKPSWKMLRWYSSGCAELEKFLRGSWIGVFEFELWLDLKGSMFGVVTLSCGNTGWCDGVGDDAASSSAISRAGEAVP